MKRILIIYCLLCIVACGPSEYVSLDQNGSILKIIDPQGLIETAKELGAEKVQLQKNMRDTKYTVVPVILGNDITYGRYYSRTMKDTVYYGFKYVLVDLDKVKLYNH
jgi:hypothetical protein